MTGVTWLRIQMRERYRIGLNPLSLRRTLLLASLALGTLLLAGIAYGIRPGADTTRLYKIGFRNTPPYHFRTPDGRPSGTTVDLISAAAARLHVRLEWVYSAEGPERALKSG